MKKVLKKSTIVLFLPVLIIGLVVVTLPSTVHAGSAFVQAKSNNGTSTSPSAVFTSTPTQGNLLFGCVSVNINVAVTVPGGWTALTQANGGAGGTTRSMRCFYKFAGAGESTTVTATVNSAEWVIEIAEYSGVDSTKIPNVESAQITNSSQTHASPTVTATTTTSGALVIGYSSIRAAGTWSTQRVNSSSSGVSERTDQNGTARSGTLYESFPTSLSGTYVADALSSASAAVGEGAIAIFSDTPAAATTANFSSISIRGQVILNDQLIIK